MIVSDVEENSDNEVTKDDNDAEISKSVNTQLFEELEKVDDENTQTGVLEEDFVTMNSNNLHCQFECAKEKELQNWEYFGVYEEVKDEGQDTLNINWVLRKKMINDNEGVKARICVRGDQKSEVGDIRKDSPTIHKINISFFYLVATQKGWKIETLKGKFSIWFGRRN